MAQVTGDLLVNHLVEVVWDGPNLQEESSTFLNYRLQATFVNSGSGRTVGPIEGFFNADNNAANSQATSGNKWVVRFRPPETGSWTVTPSFEQGTNVAANTADISNALNLINFNNTLVGNTTLKLLHFTKTNGYDHQTRNVSRDMFQDICNELGIDLTHDNDGNQFNSVTNLMQYDVIVWSNTSGDPLNSSQRANFQQYIQNGGGFIGIHAASDTYRHSSANGGGNGKGAFDFYAENATGASVQTGPNHTNINQNTMDKIGTHPTTDSAPNPWSKFEEWYYWENGYESPSFTEVLRVRQTQDPGFGGPASQNDPRHMSRVWDRPDGGKSFYTALGHQQSDYTGDQNFRNHLRDAVNWVVGTPSNNGDGINGDTETFTVAANNKVKPDFRARGFKRYIGQHFARFDDGSYLQRAAVGSPENFLGYWEFDNTFDTGDGRPQPGLIDGLHRYANHVGDWNSGDPEWQGSKGRGIIGALNYMASEGMNGLYIMGYNINNGDGDDTWMWSSRTNRTSFDVSKLEQWNLVLNHATNLGIEIQFFIQEAENDGVLSDLEYRVMIRELNARFGHLLGLTWNIGEESNNSDAKKKTLAGYFGAWDPYDHELAWHTKYDAGHTTYNGTIGDPNIDATSFQGFKDFLGGWIRGIRNSSASAGHKMTAYVDEGNPAVAQNQNSGNLKDQRRIGWRTACSGGAGVSYYFGGNSNDWGDQSLETFSQASPLWGMASLIPAFYEDNNIPFWEMIPSNPGDIFSVGEGHYKSGDSYVAYLDNGGSGTVNLSGQPGTYDVRWFNPQSGGALQTGSVSTVNGGSTVNFGSPPGGGDDWVLYIKNQNVAPMACVEYKETSGRVFIDIPDNQGTTWTEGTTGSDPTYAGYIGPNTLIWKGADQSGNPGQQPLTFDVFYTVAGIKRLAWRQRPDPAAVQDGNGFVTDGNDFFMTVGGANFNDGDLYASPDNGATKYYPIGNGSGLTPTPPGDGGANNFKIFQNFPNWSWLTQTGDFLIDNFIYLNVPAPGNYTITISPRSVNLAIDAFASWDVALSTEAAATNINNATTDCAFGGNTAPVITNPGAQADTVGDAVSLQIQAIDPDGDNMTFSAVGLPTGLSISAAGLISGTIGAGASASNNVIVTVTDTNAQPLSSTTNFTWTVSPASSNQPPVISPQSTVLLVEGGAGSIQIMATDPEGQTLTYGASGLPAGLSINTATGLISGTLTAAAGNYPITVTVTDNGTPNESATMNFSIVVQQAGTNAGAVLYYSTDGGTTWLPQPDGFVNIPVSSALAAQHSLRRKIIVDGICEDPNAVEIYVALPVVQDQSVTTGFDTAVTVDLTALASDPLGGSLTFAVQGNSPNGSTRVISGGNLTFTPIGFQGTETVIIRATTLRGDSADLNINVTVNQAQSSVNAVINSIQVGPTYFVVTGCGATKGGQPLIGDTKVYEVYRNGQVVWNSWPGGQGIDQNGLCHNDQLEYNGTTYGTSGTVTPVSGDQIWLRVFGPETFDGNPQAEDIDKWSFNGSTWARI